MSKQTWITARTDERGKRVWDSFRRFCARRGLKIGAALVRAMQNMMRDEK